MSCAGPRPCRGDSAAAANTACRGPRSAPRTGCGSRRSRPTGRTAPPRLAASSPRHRGHVAGAVGCRARSRRRSRSPPHPREMCCSPISDRVVAGGVQRVNDVLAVVVRETSRGARARACRCCGSTGPSAARRGCRSRSGARRMPCGTAPLDRPAAGCSASAPDSRTAARSGPCRGSGCRGCSAVRRGSSFARSCRLRHGRDEVELASRAGARCSVRVQSSLMLVRLRPHARLEAEAVGGSRPSGAPSTLNVLDPGIGGKVLVQDQHRPDPRSARRRRPRRPPRRGSGRAGARSPRSGSGAAAGAPAMKAL